MMNIRKIFLFCLERWRHVFSLGVVAGASLFLSGCKTTEPADSNMPWAQPAEWERQNVFNKMGF